MVTLTEEMGLVLTLKGGPQPHRTPVPGDLLPSCGHHGHQAYTWCIYRQLNMKTHKMNIKKIIKNVNLGFLKGWFYAFAM